MKKHLKQFMGTILLAAAFVLTAITVKAAQITNAIPLTANGTQKSFVLEEGNSAFYQITTDSSRCYYSITCHNNGGHDLDIKLYNGPGTDYTKILNSSVWSNRNNTYTKYLDPNTTYYLEVTSYSGTTGFVYLNKIADDYGNTFAEATPIAFGQMVEGQIEVSGLNETDFFRFTTDNSNSYYEIAGYGTGSESAELKLYEGPDSSYAHQDMSIFSGSSRTMAYKLEKNHTYYICMSGNYWGDATRYKVKVSKIPDDASDDFAGAVKLTDGKYKNGTIEIEGDVDFYRFKTAKKTTAYQLDLKNTSTITEHFTLYTRNDIASANSKVNNYYLSGGEQTTIWLNLSKNHTYYLKIDGNDGNATYKVALTSSKKTIKKKAPSSFKVQGYRRYYGSGAYASLSWKNTGSYAGYEVYRSTSPRSGFKKIKTLKDTSYYYDYGIKRHKTYYYKMRYYVKDNGKIVGGKWTKTKKVKIK
ncbi:hypothetical protein KQI22_09330 [Kineothrix sp. MSJ-39]|uniref:hypothetical protein n=1 Tax=Kineothrix sp. MSJ-39 TaxID=2841533 RepID=UPI001C10A8B5|nr:hypothetical protein [Kineothrix sp. MSJ-39]MBU5430258.1 hypothetical protein [Kineothrix sp. MSJ-39]